MQEDYESTRTAMAILKDSKRKDVLLSKSIEECKALIARYYQAIEDFDNHMRSIMNSEIRRMI